MKGLLALAAFCLCAVICAPNAAALTYSGLVRVSACEASTNVSTFYGAGWAPGYYPRYGYGRYWPWQSVYGFTYY